MRSGKGSDGREVRGAGSPWLPELLGSLYRGLLRVAPGRFQAAFAGPMEQTFRTLCRDAWGRRGVRGLARLAFREYVDLVRALTRAHLQTGGPDRPGVRRGGAGAPRDAEGGRVDRSPERSGGAGPSMRRPGSRHGGSRRRGPFESIADLLQGVEQTVRSLARRPAFTAAAVVIVALGVGANAAIFSVVDAVLLRPLPFRDADRLVSIANYLPDMDFYFNSMDPEAVAVWREQEAIFEGLEGWDTETLVESGATEPELITGARVTPGLFGFLGVSTLHGRGFREEEGRAGAEPVIVLSEGLWQERFGADPGALGRTMRLEGTAYTIVGVMPAGFRYPNPGVRFWVPVSASADARVEGVGFDVVARLRPGLDPEQAHALIDAVAADLQETRPRDIGWQIRVTPLEEDRANPQTRQALLAIFGAVSLVLLIACANVANLSLARATSRSREDAVRAALGAGRWGLARRALGENLLVGLAAGVAGLLVARAAVAFLTPRLPGRFTSLEDAAVQVDLRVVAFGLGVALLAGALAGVVPALRGAGIDLAGELASSGRGAAGSRRQRRLRGGLVVAEVAVTMVLLIGAGLLMRSFSRLTAVDPGFTVDGLLVMSLQLPSDGYPDAPSREAFFAELQGGLEALPGMQAVAMSGGVPPDGGGVRFGIQPQIRGRDPVQEGNETLIGVGTVSPGYFRTMEIPLRAGRGFRPADLAGDVPPMVVGEPVARRYWGDESPVGDLFRTEEDEPWHRVVGVAGDVRHLGLEDRYGDMELYYLMGAEDGAGARRTVVMRTPGDPDALVAAVKERVWALDPELPVRRIGTLEDRLWASLETPRFYVLLMGIFAALASVLAAVGIYGVLSYGVACRTREIGVRVALGAESGNVLGMVIRQGMGLAFLGIGLGALGALWLTRFLGTLLFEIGPVDPVTWAATAALLAAVALVSCWVPARRALRVDPMVALRSE